MDCKQCNTCGELKDSNDFYNLTPLIYRKECKSCFLLYQRKKYRERTNEKEIAVRKLTDNFNGYF